jgi:hypothetical protein
MKIVGCDLHTRYQQIAMLETETGELSERRLEHADEEAGSFYAELQGPVRVASKPLDTRAGSSGCWPNWDTSYGWAMPHRSARRWCASRGGRALPAHLAPDDGRARPAATGVASPEAGVDAQCVRWAINCTRWPWGKGCAAKDSCGTKKGRAELEGLGLGDWASYRRPELLLMVDQLDVSLGKLDQAVEEPSKQNAAAVLLRTHPGVGPVPSLAFVLTLGPVERFERSRKLVSYLGLNPREHSPGSKQRLGAISKQGNPMMRSLLVEAGHSAARWDAELRKDYLRLKLPGAVAWPRSPSPANWRYGCTGCCAAKPVTRSWFACKAARGAPWCRSRASLA